VTLRRHRKTAGPAGRTQRS